MSRKPVHRTLMPLAKQVPHFKGFAANETKSHGLEGILRQVAARSRRLKACPFYSMREVAAFFGVTLPTVARVYSRLEKDGLLLRKRSAMTELSPLKGGKHVIHRGIVAIPVWTAGFLIFRDWRLFFTELEEQLRRRHFVANFLFCRHGEEVEPAFVQRVMNHEPEYLVWLFPAPSLQANIASITEAGVRMIILDNHSESRFRDQRYRVSWEHGLNTCLADWKRRGIHTAEIPRNNGHFSSATSVLERRVREAGLACRLPEPGKARIGDFIAGLGRGKSAGVILDEPIWCTMLCSHAPQEMADLFKRTPVLTFNPLNIPPPYLSGATLDWVTPDWKAMARQVARDLDTGCVFTAPHPKTFEARWWGGVADTELAAHFGNIASE